MNRRLLIILLSAFAVAALSTYLVVRVVGNRMASVKPQSTTEVVAAATDIQIGSVLKAQDLKTIKIQGPVPEGAILKPEDAIGRGVTTPLFAGEPILNGRLAPKGSGGGLAITIKQGMRAIAVRVDQVVGVAGFVLPGTRVDVVISGVPPGENGGGSTPNMQARTVLQNIEVLSAGTDIQKDAEGKPHQVQVVNLLVTPEQAQIMTLASNQTKIQLVLRNPLDTKIAPVPGTATVNLYDMNAPAAKGHGRGTARPRPKAAPAYTIQVINGSKRSEEKFATPGGQQ
jgi:pilus assembly protein CpaB